MTGAGLFGTGGGVVAGRRLGHRRGSASGWDTPRSGALVLSQAPRGGEGEVSAGLQLIETISIALFAGLGGVLVALGVEHGWDIGSALAAIVAGAGPAAAAAGLLASRRVAPA